MADIIQIRRDTATNWSTADPVLAQGEFGWEIDTGKIKLGDGSNAYTTLPYTLAPSLITCSGRHYLSQDRWYTGANHQYGYNYYNFSEQAGSGSTPILEWEHTGVYIPAGRRLGNWHVVGRTNSAIVTDIRFHIALRYPDSPTRWTTGFDNDSEMDRTVVLDDMFVNPAVGDAFDGGNMGDMRRRSFNLNHTVAQDCFFSVYMRPTASSAGTRYFYHTWTLEVY